MKSAAHSTSGPGIAGVPAVLLLLVILCSPAKSAEPTEAVPSPKKTRTQRTIISIGGGITTDTFHRNLGSQFLFKNRLFIGSTDFYFSQGSSVGLVIRPTRDPKYGGARRETRRQHIDALLSIGYWNESLRHLALDISLGASTGVRIYDGRRARVPVIGVCPSIGIALPASHRYNVGLSFTPHFVFGSMRLYRESDFKVAVTLNIKTRNLVTPQAWRD